ncbi:MAG: hypothetical protein O3A10_13970 [Chloroflexi bacterium]|nr:hypothetical protein [Chloroflexota bacterium]MDA1147630.1 hypothetical protein [Chloroflexota bacterium]
MTNERRDDRWAQWLDTEAAAAAYPTTPDLASRVVAAARIERRAPRFAIGRAPRLAAATVVALVMLAATIAVPPARTAIGEFFGLVQGERIEVLPTPPPDVTPTAFPAPPPLENLGSPYSLEAIAAVVGFAPALPAGELPRAVFLVDYDGVAFSSRRSRAHQAASASRFPVGSCSQPADSAFVRALSTCGATLALMRRFAR